MSLDLMEEKFVHEYIKTGGNAKQAAINAGYSPDTARHAREWLKETPPNPTSSRHLPFKPELKKAIEDRRKKISNENIATTEEIMKMATSMMRGNTMEIVVSTTGKKVEVPINIRERQKAMDMLARMLGMYRDKVDLNVSPIVLEGYDNVKD